MIRLEPGGHVAMADSSGRFSFPPLPQGRYRVNVISMETGGRVADSVALGFDGLRLLASLAGYAGDMVCTRISQPPPASRPERR